MLEKFIYINSFNETLDFGKDRIFANENDLRDFAWSITTKNNKISGFKKGIVQKTIPVLLKCDTEHEGLQLRDRLFDVFEKDVLTKQHGKIQIGDYYLRCYITGSKKSEYLLSRKYMKVTLTVQTDLPEWIKETTTNHSMIEEETGEYLDFPYDFQFDFKNSNLKTSVNNSGFVPCNFIMTIHGEVVSPTIYVGNHKYSVNVTVGANEYLTIDSVRKTIVLHKSNGDQVNCFNNRSKDSYIFEKIPAGTNNISSTNGNLKFNITLLEERSEPKWI